MSRRKRYLIGKVYLINDKLVVKHYKPNRRVVVLNNDKNSIHLKRISKAANGGLNARKGIPIEKYPDIRKSSVVESKTFRKTTKGNSIKLNNLKPTKTRLNKWDMSKIIHKKAKEKWGFPHRSDIPTNLLKLIIV